MKASGQYKPLPVSGKMPRPDSVEQGAQGLKEESFPSPISGNVVFEAHEFTAVCPRTGQPDFGKVIIEYTPSSRCLESKSVKFYLWAFREYGGFSEQIAQRIFNDVYEAIDPISLKVTVLQSVRGGIGLTATATEYRPDIKK